jgi:hypothetical protein
VDSKRSESRLNVQLINLNKWKSSGKNKLNILAPHANGDGDAVVSVMVR